MTSVDERTHSSKSRTDVVIFCAHFMEESMALSRSMLTYWVSVRLSEHSLVSVRHVPRPRREPPDGFYGHVMLDDAAGILLFLPSFTAQGAIGFHDSSSPNVMMRGVYTRKDLNATAVFSGGARFPW